MGYILRAALGLLKTSAAEAEVYVTTKVVELSPEEKAAGELARKVSWAQDEALAALSGKGMAECFLCEDLRGYLKNIGLPTTSAPVFSWDLPILDRDGVFPPNSMGVKTHGQHLAAHLYGAAKALFEERLARKAERATRAAIRDAATLDKMSKGILDGAYSPSKPKQASRRKGGRFTSPEGKWHSGNRRNKG